MNDEGTDTKYSATRSQTGGDVMNEEGTDTKYSATRSQTGGDVMNEEGTILNIQQQEVRPGVTS